MVDAVFVYLLTAQSYAMRHQVDLSASNWVSEVGALGATRIVYLD